MHFSYQFLLSFIMVFVFAGMMIMISSRHTDRKVVVNTFNIFVASVAMWCASMAMFYYPLSSKDLLIFWAKAQFFTGSLIAASIMFFSLLYPAEKFTTPLYFRLMVFIPNVIFYYLCFFTPFIVKDVAEIRGCLGWVRGPYSFIWHIYFFMTCTLAFMMFFKKYKTSSGTIRERFRFIIAAFMIGVLLSAVPSVIMPFILNRFELYWMGAPLTFTWVVFIAYAIFKKPLMEIPHILKRSLLYSILISLLALFQFTLVLSIKQYFPFISKEMPLLPLAVSTVFLLMFLFPLKNLLGTYIDKYIFSKNYFKIVEENELLKEEAAQTEKYKSLATLFNRIILEIKNPLTTLKGYSYCLPDKAGDKDFLKEFAVTLRNEVDRINNLVSHLTEYNKPTSIATSEVDLFEFMDEAINVLKSNLLHENIKVVKNYNKEGAIKLFVDTKQLRQAFLNIIVNSIDAMPNGGNLRIDAVLDNQNFKISIFDSGLGVSKNFIGKVFEPFFTTKKDHPGLGLPVALGIIENHGGSIHIESEENVGTEVVIELPVKTNFEFESRMIRIG